MRTPTLGYEDDTTISKAEIARIQLIEAIGLFVDEKFLCALTLAGAAEDIFARLLNSCGEKSAVEDSFEQIQKIRDITGLTVMENKKKNEIFSHFNYARNSVKHFNKKESEIVKLNLFDEGYWMIKRALANAKCLEIQIDNELDFENWCIEQIHL